jgi:thiamine kinase-like enzyme
VHQRIGNPRTSSIKIDDLKSQIEEELIALRRYSKERVNIDTYRQKLYELLGAVSNSSVPTALLHDDFQYSNILISSSGSACALDSSFSRRGAVYSDVATLLVDPETRLVQLLSFGLFLSKQRIVQLRELVLESYFQDSPINQLSLKLYCALAILHKWTVDEKRFSSGGLQQLLSPLLIPVIRFNFKRILKPYLSLHVERKKS